VDAVSLFREKVEEVLIVASWVAALRRELGLQAVSQVFADQPAWYLWLAGAAGAFRLALEQTLEEEHHGRGVLCGVFSLKCYPFAGGPWEAGFSPEERQLVRSPAFDRTGTPCFEAQDRVPPHLFNLAACELALEPSGGWALWSLESLDQLCTEQEGRAVRRVPGWELARRVMDAWLGLVSFQRRQAPARAAVVRTPGYRSLARPAGVEHRPDPDRLRRVLWVLYGRAPAGLWEARLAGEGGGLEAAANGQAQAAAAGLPPAWWGLASREMASDLGGICSCCGESHEGCAHGRRP
jgi:hypothetical protein